MTQEVTPDAFCLFCEDVRNEVGERTTLVGVFKSSLNVPNIPGALPKLGFYANVRNIPQRVLPKTIKFQIRSDWSDDWIVDINVDEDTIKKLREDRKKNPDKHNGIILSGIVSPFEVSAAGKITAYLTIGRKRYECGELTFRDTSNPKKTN